MCMQMPVSSKIRWKGVVPLYRALRTLLLIVCSVSTLHGQDIKEITARVQSLTPEQIPAILSEAESGNITSQLLLGLAYRFGRGVNRDQAEAAKWLRKASDGGSAPASNDLGVMYQYGVGVSQNDNEAARLFMKAAAADDAAAQANLGYMYMQGLGVPKDTAKAFDWTWKSAQQGYEAGETNLGLMYLRGEGTQADVSKAIQLFTEASNKGYVEAQGLLGFSYFMLDTADADAPALKWLSTAAQHGDRRSVNFLPLLKGGKAKIEAPEDLTALRRRAEEGDPQAQSVLAALHMTAQQPAAAFFWYSLLAGNKEKGARDIEKSAQKMVNLMPKAGMISNEQMAAAKIRVEQWRMSHEAHQ